MVDLINDEMSYFLLTSIEKEFPNASVAAVVASVRMTCTLFKHEQEALATPSTEDNQQIARTLCGELQVTSLVKRPELSIIS
jgi:hypothetical protein